MCALIDGTAPKVKIDLARDEIGERGRAATIGHDDDLDVGNLAELLAGEMNAGADAGRRKGELARIGLGVIDEVFRGLERREFVHRQHKLRA